MLSAVLISVGSLLLLILLTILYKIKIKKTGFKNVLFEWMLYIHILVMSLEIVSCKTIYLRNSMPIINEIVCRLDYLLAITWLFILCGYILGIKEGLNYKSIREYIKNEKNYKLLFVVYILTIIAFFILKIEYEVNGNYGFALGPAVYLSYFVGVSVVLIAIILLIKNIKVITKRAIPAIAISLIETFTLVPLQLIFPEVLIVTSGFALKLYVIYFALENPDLYVIKALDKAKEKAEKSNKAKTDFLSNMSHEIRTPMNAILGFSETILNQDEYDQNEIKKDITHIYSAGSNLLEIINNILDISKIETEEEIIEEKEYSLGNVILELSSIIDARLDKEKVKFITDIDEDIPSILLGDKTKVFQILLNILSNSAKYTEYGNIKLKATKKIDGNKVNLRFVISDTGYGIKKEDYNKLFEKFSRLDSATQNEIEGTGLGLVITKRLVNLLGGTIQFESEYGVGTTFYIDLTQKIVNYSKLGKITDEKNTEKTLDFIDCSKYKILLVDDNKLNIKVAERVLEPYKFNIESVTSGMECVNKIKSGCNYDLIFLDHMMPGMDGIEVLHILKNLKDFNIPPIVVLTANAITGMKEMYLNEGFDDYLSKPINTSDLNKIILKYFEGKK